MAEVSDYTALLTEYNWNSDLGARPVFVTFSFETSIRPYFADAGYSQAAINSFQPFSANDQSMARNALAQWAASTGVFFLEVPAGHGDISFGRYNLDLVPNGVGAAGLGYYPNVFINSNFATKSEIGGDVLVDLSVSNLMHVLLHEIGHALGFKHPFDGTTTLSSTYDNRTYTVMSYTGPGPGVLGSFDVPAAQSVYGTTDGSHLYTWGWDAYNLTLTQTDNDDGDTLIGNSVNDVVYGWGGADTIAGFEGKDWIDGGDGSDRLYGGAGDDALFGGAGNDFLYGEAGYNTLGGGAGDDDITGGTADDIITGDQGNDVMYGGDGNDVISELWFPLDPGNDTINAGNGIDVIYSGAGADIVNGGTDAANNYANLGEGADSYQGSAGTDVVVGGPGDDRIWGYDGADSLWGDDGSDYIEGGFGIDTVVGGFGNDRLFGDAGNDLLVGMEGLDWLFGGAGVDVLYGGDQSDILNGGPGGEVDALYGENGPDEFRVGGSGFGADYLWDFVPNVDRIVVYAGTTIATQFAQSGNYYLNFNNGTQAVVVGVTALGAFDIEFALF